MRNKYIIFIAICSLFLMIMYNVSYADDNRKGFIFSTGLGLGYMNVSSNVTFYTTLQKIKFSQSPSCLH